MMTIGICGRPPSSGLEALFDALGRALGVSFQARPFDKSGDVAAWIVLGADRQWVERVSRAARPSYAVIDDAELVAHGTSSRLTFVNRPEVAAVLRGRETRAEDAATAKVLPSWLGDAVPLAFKDGVPVWSVLQRGECRHHCVALPPPELAAGEALFVHFGGRRIARLLPLVLFVQALSDAEGWQPPPLQAAFMFDDPNLHWTSYGFIDFAEMVRHAAAGGYHVSMATIPLDGWFVHRSAGDIFRQNRRWMSLLYHGNDHVHHELARYGSADVMHQLLRQAMARVARLEARAGVEVARVMAAPHGACREPALAEMDRLGFEALCVSRGSLRRHNPGAEWVRSIGFAPCDTIAGLPVIPRFGLSADCRNDVLVAALLHQPIVPIAHHQAVADGYRLLDETASFIGSVGDVLWRDMKAISRSLYSHRQDGTRLHIRMWSKRVTVSVPPGTTEIFVDRARADESTADTVFWRPAGDDRSWRSVDRQQPVGVTDAAAIEIVAGRARAERIQTVAIGPHRVRPVARRLLTEARDRALPSIRRLAFPGLRNRPTSEPPPSPRPEPSMPTGDR